MGIEVCYIVKGLVVATRYSIKLKIDHDLYPETLWYGGLRVCHIDSTDEARCQWTFVENEEERMILRSETPKSLAELIKDLSSISYVKKVIVKRELSRRVGLAKK